MQDFVDYRGFLEKHDLLWTRKPQSWCEGPFLGNGRTGLLLHFDREEQLRLMLGNTDVYDNRLDPSGKMSLLFLKPRLPLGSFVLSAKGGLKGCEMRLSLFDAAVSGTLGAASGTARFWGLVTEGADAFFFSWQETGEAFSVSYEGVPAVSPRQTKMLESNNPGYCRDYAPPKAPYTKEDGGATAYIQPKFEGGAYAVVYRVYTSGNEKTLVVMVQNTESDKEPPVDFAAFSALYPARRQLEARHAEFWHAFYEKSFLSLDDTQKEGFYWIQLYKCACASRGDTRVFDTAGPWLPKSTSWPGTWWNLNAQLNYSPLFPANHTELTAALPNQLRIHRLDLEKSVPAQYRGNGYCTLGRCTGADLCSPCEVPGEGTTEANLEPGNLLWALHGCYVHFASLCDEAGLREELYPFLKKATAYVCLFVRQDASGDWHLLPTASPEYPGLGTDCSYTLSLLKWALLTLRRLNERFGISPSDTAWCETWLSRLPDLPCDENEGIRIAGDIRLSESHRHYSHLLAFYPLHWLGEREGENRTLIEKSIRHWQSMPEGLQGYSQSGAASMYAVLSDGNRALMHLNRLFDGFIQPNTMYEEGDNPVLETPPAAARSILDMVFLSFEDELRVFTGCPDAWKNVCFRDLLAQNGCTVTAKRENGQLRFVKIHAKSACEIRLYADFGGKTPEASGAYRREEGAYCVRLAEGSDFYLSLPGETGAVAPVKAIQSGCHAFGLR